LAFLLTAFGILKTIGSVIGAILKAIPPIGWLCIVCIIVGMMITWKGCERPRLFPKREKRVTNHISEVVEVLNGVSIKVKNGIFERRTTVIMLRGIASPAKGEKYYEASKENLTLLCGGFIWVKSDSEMVYGETGACLQLAQLNSGFAKCVGDAPKEWLAAEKYAKKMKLGIWNTKGE
jgi:endonuclease YncB( thermonuclease family)